MLYSRGQVRDTIVQGAGKGCCSPGGRWQVRDAIVQGAGKGYYSPGGR